MPNSINLQHFKLISGYINGENNPVPGAGVSSSQVSGSIVQPYYGFAGGVLDIDALTAAKFSNTTNGTLYEGQYQMVQFLSTEATAVAIGAPVYWSDRTNYIVTTDVTAALSGQIAGIALNVVTAGNWGFIQISGRATCKFRAAITKVTPAIGDLVVLTQTPANTFDVLADATGLTSPILKTVVGVATALPVSNAASLVDVKFITRSVF